MLKICPTTVSAGEEKGLNYGESFQTLTSETIFGEKAALARLRNPSKTSWETLGITTVWSAEVEAF